MSRASRRRWCYVYCAIDSCGALVDVLFDMAAAKVFFRSARAVTGIMPDRVTTDDHDSYPRAIRAELGKAVRHWTSRYLNNRLEQDHGDLKGRYQPMRGFVPEIGSAVLPRPRRTPQLPSSSHPP